MCYVLCGLMLLLASCGASSKPDNDVAHFTRFTEDVRDGRLIRLAEIEATTINVLKRTIFIIMDIMYDEKDEKNYKTLIENYLDQHNLTVFLVQKNYKRNVKLSLSLQSFVRRVSEYILELFKKTKEEQLNLHLIGYKSGAYVVALVARNVAEETKKKIPRVTILSPFYDVALETLIVSKDDVEFVDVTHANAKDVDYIQLMGHIDFFPNGDHKQPGCDIQGDFFDCSQSKVLEYFAESVVSDKFKAFQCSSWEEFEAGGIRQETIYGEKVDKEARGAFCFKTDK